MQVNLLKTGAILLVIIAGTTCNLSTTYAQMQGLRTVYIQPPSLKGILYQSSWWIPTETSFDQYVWDDFTIPASLSIAQIRWRGGYDPGKLGSGGPVTDFSVALYASRAAGTEPDVINPPLAKYQTGGNAGETLAGTFEGIPMYDYTFTLPTPFQTTGGTVYWIQIEAFQEGLPDWGIAQGSGGNGKHYRKLTFEGDAFYQTVPGDAAFTLLAFTGVENEDVRIHYDGWQGVRDRRAKGGSYRVSNVRNDRVSFVFAGKKFTWITMKGPDMGIAHVIIDNVSKGDVDLYQSKPVNQFQQSYAGLSLGTHTAVIEVSGRKNLNATDTKVVFDAATAGQSTLQDTSYKVMFNDWQGKNASKATSKNYRSNGTDGAVVQMNFRGDQIDWITARGPKYGHAEVFIDGVSQGITDLYHAVTQWQTPISFKGLGSGKHTIQVQILGTNNPLSEGTGVVVDAFQGPMVPVK